MKFSVKVILTCTVKFRDYIVQSGIGYRLWFENKNSKDHFVFTEKINQMLNLKLYHGNSIPYFSAFRWFIYRAR